MGSPTVGRARWGRSLVALLGTVLIGAVGVAGVVLIGGEVLGDDEPGPPGVEDESSPGQSGRDLLLADDFDAEELDRDRWRTCFWWVEDGGCTIASNDEQQWYQPDEVSVRNGALRLRARERTVAGPDSATFPYTSGMVTTGPEGYEPRFDPSFSFTYGYVEARIRVPRGQGLWPAFWLLPVDRESRPEIDVLEVLGDSTDVARVHYHYSDDAGEAVSLGESVDGPDLAEGWHTVAVDWRPGVITWFVDDREVWEHRGDEVSSEPMYLVANLAVGGDYPGPPGPDTSFPAELAIDWIRVWAA